MYWARATGHRHPLAAPRNQKETTLKPAHTELRYAMLLYGPYENIASGARAAAAPRPVPFTTLR